MNRLNAGILLNDANTITKIQKLICLILRYLFSSIAPKPALDSDVAALEKNHLAHLIYLQEPNSL